MSPRLFKCTNTIDCSAKGWLAMSRAPSACRFTPRARIEPDSLEILASNRTFILWLTRRSGCPNGRFSGRPRPATAHRPRFRMLNTPDARSFAEAVVCAIDSMMGCAAAEEKYHRLELRQWCAAQIARLVQSTVERASRPKNVGQDADVAT
jgi:hypothetical protein